MNALNSFPSARDKTIEQKWNKTVKDTQTNAKPFTKWKVFANQRAQMELYENE